MDSLRGLIDSFKLTAYDLVAVLLPGALLVYGLGLAAAPVPGGPLAALIVCYFAGLVAQGASGLLSRRRTPPELLQEARKLILERYGRALPDWLLIDFCLTKLEGRRSIYEKFVALRGMARALSLSALIVGIPRIAQARTLEARGLAAVATALVAGSLYALYRHYAPLADRSVVGMFVAAESPLLLSLAAAPAPQPVEPAPAASEDRNASV